MSYSLTGDSRVEDTLADRQHWETDWVTSSDTIKRRENPAVKVLFTTYTVT